MNSNIPLAQKQRLSFLCLLGVSIGDAFGDSFFGSENEVLEHIDSRKIPQTSWEFTDDTVLSIAIFNQIRHTGEIDEQALVQKFVHYHNLDVNRGYGATFRRNLREIEQGGDWREISQNAFDGNGSMGNGAAMRVCPIGAFHFDNLEKVKELAAKSARTTHANIEAVSGAIAVAVGTALAVQAKFDKNLLEPLLFLQKIISQLPESDTKSKIQKSLNLPYDAHIETVRKILGNGIKMTSQDTVPFVLWCAAHNLENFEEALWKAVCILGDRDTICAMVGGITILSADENTVPQAWKNAVEKFENSIFYNTTNL